MYFNLNSVAKNEITGNYPQIELKKDTFKNNIRPDYKKLSSQELASKKLNLNDFVYSQNAIITDILSSNILSEKIGLVINKKALDIFSNYSNKFVEFIPMIINDNMYYFMHIISCTELIDFKNSIFKDMLNEGIEETIDSFKSYINRREDTFLKAKEIKIKEKIELFRLPFDTEVIVSKKLKQDIEQSQISGIEIKPYTNFLIK